MLGFERISDEQIPLMQQEEHDGQVELDSLIERLALRLGEERVARARLAERAARRRSVLSTAAALHSALGRACHIQALGISPAGPSSKPGLASRLPEITLPALNCPVATGRPPCQTRLRSA